MSNRLLWILIIIWFIWIWYIYYHLEYLPNEQIKKINEEKIDNTIVKLNIEKKELSKDEKIIELKENIKNYKTFTLWNLSKVYFKENNNNLDIYLEDEKIWFFPLVYKEFLRVDLIRWTESDLYIEVWPKKYYYNYTTKIIRSVDLNIDIHYVKKISDKELLFITKKWPFKYYIKNHKLEYISYFNDFVYFNDWYIWVINKNEKRILKNLWFNTESNLIVYYNSYTKEKSIIYETNLDIKEIYVKDNKFYFVSNNKEIFELENIKK